MTFNIFSEVDGYYNVNARILNADGDEICWGYDNFQISANQTNEITLVFSLSQSEMANLGYKFSLGSLSIYNTSSSSELDSLYVDEIELESYNLNDVICLRTFLEQKDSKGVKNGTKINSNYNANSPATWTDVTWTTINGEKRVTKISWRDLALVGQLDLSGCTALKELFCDDNKLTSLDVSKNSALFFLVCSVNPLKFLDVSKNTALEYLYCQFNSLTSLDLSYNTELKRLNCSYNYNIATLDVSKNISLTELVCGYNNLTSLDVSHNTALEWLQCSSNRLTSLDLSNNTNLWRLGCSSNQLTSLDLSNNTALMNMFCDSNPLTLLNLSQNMALREIYCWNSSLKNIILPSIRSRDMNINLNYNSNSNWTFRDVNNRTLGTNNSSSDVFVLTPSIELPFYAVNNSGSQTISFIDPSWVLSSPMLNVTASGSNSINVTVGSMANTSEYVLQYSTSSDFTNAITRSILDGVTVVNGLKENTTYFFRVMAIADGFYIDSDFSSTKSATTYTHDVGSLRSFLEQTDSNGVKNGTKLNSNYNANNTSTWAGVTWTNINGVIRVTAINWTNKQLSGSLDLSGCTALTVLKCYSNQLTSLNVLGCTALTELNCNSNQLTELDVSENTLLELLYCYNNQLDSLNLSSNTALTNLLCYSNQLTSLNVPKNSRLTRLWCHFNKLTSLNVSGSTALTELRCLSNQLNSLDVSGCTSLGVIICHTNQLTTLNISGCYALTDLNCGNNKLTLLNLTGCPALTDLNCSNNQLTSLNVSKCIALTALNCTNNQLTTLDASKNTALITLLCFANRLTSLNVTGCTALTELQCRTNQLTSLDVSKNTALEILYCHDNQLTTLNVSKNTALVTLGCWGNKLVSLNVSQNTALTTLNCWNSTLQNVILPSARSQTIDLALSTSSRTNWTFQNANNAVLGTSTFSNNTYTSFSLDQSTALPIFATNPSGSQKITFTDSLTNLLKVSVNGNKVTVNWDDVYPEEDVISYRVAGAAKWTTKKLKAGVTTYTFNAALGSNYEIELLLDKQENKVLHGTAVVLDQAKLATVKTSIVDDAFQVNVTNYTTKNLAAEAKQAILTVNGVQTTLNIANQQGSAALTNGGNVTFVNGLFTFTGMNSNTSYKVQVSFSDGISDSKVSSALTVKTTKAPYLVPNIVSATTISDTSVEVKWATSYGKNTTQAAAAYTVQYSIAGTNKWSNATTKAIGNSFTVTKLKGGTSYEFRVFATKDNTFLASGFSNALTATTFPSAPKIASVVSKTVKTAVLTWNVPTGVQKFDLRYCLKGTSNWQTVTVMATGEAKMSYTFTGLTSGKAYEFQVRAIDARLNTSAWSVSKVLTKVL